jgi:hypothetical protein
MKLDHFVEKLLKRFAYSRLKRREKGIVIQFLIKVSGYSRQQLTRMIQRYVKFGEVKRQQKTMNGFKRFYTGKDTHLLAQLDQRHDTPNGLMLKKLCERAYHEFNDLTFERLSHISVSHIYNLRHSPDYKKYRCHYEKTKPACFLIACIKCCQRALIINIYGGDGALPAPEPDIASNLP